MLPLEEASFCSFTRMVKTCFDQLSLLFYEHYFSPSCLLQSLSLFIL